MDERDLLTLASELPAPVDDGAAAHLPGTRMPPLELPATDGSAVRLDRLGEGRTVVYAFPRTGRPDEPPLVPDWDRIPGARGCTVESCAFRDRFAGFAELGARVLGVSTQPRAYQREAVERLGLPFPLLSDERLELARALRLPTFAVAGQELLKRLTLVVRDGVVEHVWYPVFPPDTHPAEVEAWLRARARAEPTG